MVVCNVSTRYKSTRFPGKAITPILGKPMTIWVADVCAEAVGKENVFISHDDERIVKKLRPYGYALVKTPSKLLNCSERAAHIADVHGSDYVIDVQNDEPCITVDMIKKVQRALLYSHTTIQAISKIQKNSQNIIKVVFDERGYMMYASRANIPFRAPAYRQVCIYGYTKDTLKKVYGDSKQTPLEKAEKVHILRVLEKRLSVKTCVVKGATHPVDVPEDVQIVEKILSKRQANGKQT